MVGDREERALNARAQAVTGREFAQKTHEPQ